MHGIIGQQGTPLRVLGVRGEFFHQLGCRVHQHLQAQFRAAAAQGFLGQCSAEVTASGVTTHGQPGRVDPQLCTMFCDPIERSQCIFAACGQVVFRRQAVTHGNDDAIGGKRDAAADAIGGVQVADDKPTAEVPEECWSWFVTGAGVENPQGYRAARPFELPFGYRSDRLAAPECKRQEPPDLAQLG
ncbi:hypothetical protein D3C80_972340 [compost metagenome]